MALSLPDVSNYQGHVDWQAVLASGRAGGIVKASEGVTYTDPTFASNWQALGTLDAVRGAYHFARPTESNPQTQAARFCSIVNARQPADILVLDLEVGTGNLSPWALGFLQEVERLTGVIPWIYSYAPFIKSHLTDPALADYPLWLAAYQQNPPVCPAPWKTYTAWQHTDAATIPGITGRCDESFYYVIHPPTPTSSVVLSTSEEAMTRITIGPFQLDGSGNGWQSVNVPFANFRNAFLLGSNPPTDGYWSIPKWGAQDRAGATVIELTGGVPNQTVTLYVDHV